MSLALLGWYYLFFLLCLDVISQRDKNKESKDILLYNLRAIFYIKHEESEFNYIKLCVCETELGCVGVPKSKYFQTTFDSP